ncbi:MAG: hypothetical protein JST24_09645 [Acidobacteria bacterium]|nr:hypothetical protein [Acidobacteriota bacterium]
MKPASLLQPFVAITLCAALGAGQGAPTPKAATATQAPAVNPAPNPAMRSRLILVQHASPYMLRDLLRPLLSAGSGSTMDAMDRDGMRALTIRDFPENLAAIEEAVKRLDVDAPARKQVEFHIHILFATKQESAGAAVPDELKDVLDSLKSTLAYRSYTPVASFVQRAADGAEVVEGQGQAEMTIRTPKGEAQAMPLILKWGIYHLAVATGPDGKPAISFPKFELSAYESLGSNQGARLASIETNLAMKDGDKVVVGTSMIRDKALVVVVTAKIVE